MTDVNPKLIDQIRCSRPILFENDSTEFRYSAQGTCFLCTLDTALFIVTAKHVLQSFTAEEIRVPFSYSAKEFIPYTGVCSPGREIGDLERADLSIMPVPSAFREHPLFGDQGPLMLADDTIERAQERGADLVLRGFPCHSNGIDYDTKTITRTGEVFGAVVIGPSSFDEDCTELKFNDLSRCDGVDGLSGSPVFTLGSTAPTRLCLAGMLLRATNSGSGHMLRAHRILEFARYVALSLEMTAAEVAKAASPSIVDN